MNYSQLIHEYLDLGLDHSNEQVLFSQLATDMDVRHDFNLQLRMHKATSEHNKFIAPPMEVTNQLFGNLGFSIPTAIVATSEASRPIATAFMSSIALGLLNFVRDNYVTMLSFIAGSAIASMLMYWIGIESPNNQKIYANKSTNLKNNQSPQNLITIPIASNKEIENKVGKTNKINNSNLALLNKPTLSNTNSFDNFSISNNNFGSKSNISDDLIKDLKSSLGSGGLIVVKENIYKDNFIENPINTQQVQRIVFSNNKNENITLIRDNFDNKNIRYTRFVLEDPSENSAYIRSLSTNESKPGNTIGNLIAGYHHYFIDNVALKVEMGLEQYNLLKFQVESSKNEIKNESIGWFGVGASLNARELVFIPNEIFPFADFIIGGTTQGFIGRGQVGLEFVPESKIGIIVGYEYIQMYYRDNQIYKSLNRTGLSVGMKLSF